MSKLLRMGLIGLALLQAGLAAAPKAQASQVYTLHLPVIARNYTAGYVLPFGVTMYGGVNDANGLEQMATARSARVTAWLHWWTIEKNAPVGGVHTYDWSSFDADVKNARSKGMQMFVLASDNPPWAAATLDGPVTDTQSLVDFVGAAAGRYPDITDWSFYPEPDNKYRFGNRPAAYADMLAAVSPAVHAANPKARVINGGLAYDGFTWGFVQSFLPGVLDALSHKPGGIRAYLDAVAFHHYNLLWPNIADKARVIRDVMAQYGVGDLPLLVPEFGVPSFNTADQPNQARQLVQTFVRGLSAGIEQLSWFSVYDDGCDCGLFASMYAAGDLSHPKLAYTAYTNMANELYGSTYLSALGLPGVEGYEFTNQNGLIEAVLWATQPTAVASFASSCLRTVDALGVTTIVHGNQVTLSQDQPLYVAPCN